jgi:hypothetical protein
MMPSSLFVGALLVGIGSWIPQSNTDSRAVSRVYEVMLADSRCSGVGSAGAQGRDLVVRREAVVPDRKWWWNSFPHTDFVRDIPAWLPGITLETVQSSTNMPAPPGHVDSSLRETVRLEWISQTEVDALGKKDAFWLLFYKRHASASGLIELSEVGFGTDRREALAYCGRTSESLAGSGFLVLLRSDGQRWKAVAWRQVWQS